MVQQEIEAVVMEEDVEEEEGVVLQEEGCPAVIVEEVPSAQVEECYSAQVLVYDDETYLMPDVAEEQEVVTEVTETGKTHFFEYEIQLLPKTGTSRNTSVSCRQSGHKSKMWHYVTNRIVSLHGKTKRDISMLMMGLGDTSI